MRSPHKGFIFRYQTNVSKIIRDNQASRKIDGVIYFVETSSPVRIPLPTAIYDHQMKNAKVMEAAGAAVVLPQADLTGAT